MIQTYDPKELWMTVGGRLLFPGGIGYEFRAKLDALEFGDSDCGVYRCQNFELLRDGQCVAATTSYGAIQAAGRLLSGECERMR